MRIIIRNKKNPKNLIYWAGILPAQYFIFSILYKTSDTTVLFLYTFFIIRQNAHSLFFSCFPFSVGDLFYTFLLVYFIFLLYSLLFRIQRMYIAKKILILFNVLFFLYQIFWGFLYYKESIFGNSLSVLEAHTQDLKDLATSELSVCKELRKEVRENTQGIFTIPNIDSLKVQTLRDQEKIPKILRSGFENMYLNIKPSLYSDILSYTGILGYYNPFSSEVQFNSHLPDSQIPFTLSHETAHQRGIAREQEANFIAYLTGSESRDLSIRYSIHLNVLKNTLSILNKKDPVFVSKIKTKFSRGIKADLENEKKHQQQFQGKLNLIFYTINDLFLKSNKQQGNSAYTYYINYIIYYKKKIELYNSIRKKQKFSPPGS
ncbi:MAG: DUF3810 domain-containing protein [Bergeyella sp.]|nr:DUF3810 domain-containing protein [Bergeyella sp.]